MTDRFDWEAPIEPGRTMLGLTLGLKGDAVREILGCDDGTSHKVAEFPNSPRLLIDCGKFGVILLRAADMENVEYGWQNVLARLVFNQDVLESIVVQTSMGGEAYAYKGKILGKVGLGEQVANLLEFGALEFDDAEEVFLSDGLKGLEVSGTNACDLSVDPSQVVTFIRIF